jgi:hypothetical protein
MQDDQVGSDESDRALTFDLERRPQRSVVEAKVQLTSDLHLASNALDQSHDGRSPVVDRHEIHQSDAPRRRLELGLEDQGIGLVATMAATI